MTEDLLNPLRTARCRWCRVGIWRSLAGWVHTERDARSCDPDLVRRREPWRTCFAEPALTGFQRTVLNATLPWEPRDADDLVVRAGSDKPHVIRALVRLEYLGLVESAPAKSGVPTPVYVRTMP